MNQGTSHNLIHLEIPGAKGYRPSRYNHFHTLPSGEKLAYNALAVLDREGVGGSPAKPCTG